MAEQGSKGPRSLVLVSTTLPRQYELELEAKGYRAQYTIILDQAGSRYIAYYANPRTKRIVEIQRPNSRKQKLAEKNHAKLKRLGWRVSAIFLEQLNLKFAADAWSRIFADL